MIMNLGCGKRNIPGTVNVDCKFDRSIDVVARAEALPFKSGVFCETVASHVLEHISDIISAMREIHRTLEENGNVYIATPYGGSDGAWEDPTHVRCFTEASWAFFDKKLYENKETLGYYHSPVDFTFKVINITLIPHPEFSDVPKDELLKMIRRERNIVNEMQAVLQKGSIDG
jgi:SAM-dependent methyltransferase